MDNRMLKKRAVRNPLTANPLTNLSAISMIKALMANKNRPRVTMVAGRVKKIKSGLTNMFKIAITRATMKAVP
tara:strand:+ start:70628 stop:70846 length:219 start_codon:yes stop_codon:yes gene_type:complete